MGNDGLKSSSSSKHNNLRQPAAQQSKDDDDIEFSKPQSRMNKIRRSLSFRKKKTKKEPQQQQPIIPATTTAAAIATTASTNEKYTIDTTKPTSWQEDERRVRDGTCSFHVKYLGSIEVFDSRGMHICEQAIERQIAVSYKE